MRDQLRRYCRGEQDGVSILISGTRGMGKTTMAKLVVQRLIAYDTGLIPLPLILHGPTLLRPDAEADPPRRATGLPTRDEEKLAEELNKVRLKRWVLRSLIAALYQHVCMHIVEAWENAISQSGPRSRWRSRDRRRLTELQQLKAHLALKLDEAPNVSTLRKLWRRAGFLPDGVLCHLYPDCGRGRLGGIASAGLPPRSQKLAQEFAVSLPGSSGRRCPGSLRIDIFGGVARLVMAVEQPGGGDHAAATRCRQSRRGSDIEAGPRRPRIQRVKT